MSKHFKISCTFTTCLSSLRSVHTLLPAISSRSFAVNHLVKHQHSIWLDSADAFKALNHKPTSSVSLGHSVNPDIQKRIGYAYTGPAILNIIKNHRHDIVHPSIFGKAIKKCDSLRDFESVISIMDLLLTSSLNPTEIEFNIFLNSMSRADRPGIASKYYNLMTRQYSITPDLVTFSAMIRSCRSQRLISDAEKYWEQMKGIYRLQPDEYLYSTMIAAYSTAQKTEKAVALFHEYLDGVKGGYLRRDISPFSAFLNVHCRRGDIKGMKEAVDLIKSNGFPLTKFVITDIVRGYIEADRGDKALRILEKWESEGNVATKQMLIMKCGILIRQIRRQNGSFEERHALYREVMSVDLGGMGKMHLDAAIALYSDRDPMEIVNVFERLLMEKKIGYLGQHEHNGSISLDFHLFSLHQAQFIIRYVFAFKLRELMEDRKRLCIVVGKGNHRKEGRRSLKDFMVQELSSWNPSVHCVVDESNDGVLIVEMQDLSTYLNASDSAKEVFLRFYIGVRVG